MAVYRPSNGEGEWSGRGVSTSLGEAKQFRRKIIDQKKLDTHLDSVREFERRLKLAGNQAEFQGWWPTLNKLNVLRPTKEIPPNLADHMRLMCDILVAAFQTEAARASTLKLNNEHRYLQFPHLMVKVGHHELPHFDRGKMALDWLKVNQFLPE